MQQYITEVFIAENGANQNQTATESSLTLDLWNGDSCFIATVLVRFVMFLLLFPRNVSTCVDGALSDDDTSKIVKAQT
eukprot:1083201-Amphidinium_carterae.1